MGEDFVLGNRTRLHFSEFVSIYFSGVKEMHQCSCAALRVAYEIFTWHFGDKPIMNVTPQRHLMSESDSG